MVQWKRSGFRSKIGSIVLKSLRMLYQGGGQRPNYRVGWTDQLLTGGKGKYGGVKSKFVFRHRYKFEYRFRLITIEYNNK
jgi:hypothetical protein